MSRENVFCSFKSINVLFRCAFIEQFELNPSVCVCACAVWLQLFFYSEVVELAFAAAGALLFCGFIIYDTHLLMHKLSPEEYILAAINLYLDIINLFLHLLRLLEAFNKK